MLLRKLNVKQGLCNEIRLIVRRLQNHTIDCEVAMGSNKGSRMTIPTIIMITFFPLNDTGISPLFDFHLLRLSTNLKDKHLNH